MRRLTLTHIIILGLALRLLFVAFSDHLHYPDELYQTLEPAHRIAFEYGVETWDYRYHLRPYIIPLILSLLMRLFPDPEIYLPLIRSLSAISSLILIPTAYLLTLKITNKRQNALMAAGIVAIWYELIYFSSRSLTEVFATHLFAAAYLLFEKKSPKPLIGGFSAGIATLIRPQYFIITIALGLLAKKRLAKMWWGIALAILTVGAADYIGYGSFLTSLVQNYRLSFASGMSSVFGSSPTYYYPLAFLITSGLLVIPALYTVKFPKARPFAYTAIAILILHSLIPHKEYRFLYLLIPLLLVLATVSLSRLKSLNGVYVGIILISLLGIANRLPWQHSIYEQPLIFKDPSLALYKTISREQQVCGVYDTTRQWVYTGGYTYLHHSVPTYDIDSPPASDESVSHVITINTGASIPGYHPIATTPPFTVYFNQQTTPIIGYTLYKKDGPCTPITSPEYYRSVGPIEDFINTHPTLYTL